LLLVSAALLGACQGGGEESPSAGIKISRDAPIILISIDTLRADRLPAYGYGEVETPNLDALQREGVLYERAYSHIPLTLPSHASLLTGLLPPDHGIRDNIGYRLDSARVQSEEVPFLPQLLKRRGYATGAAVSSFVLRQKMGLGTSFDFYEDSIEFRTGTGLGGLQRPGLETLDLARPWLREASPGPFFFFFHIYEPHTPYAPPEPFASRYSSPYDGEVAAADAVIGALFDELRELGVYDRALIILLSDHGESLGEHGEDEHGVLLYTATLHVPLILKLPGARLAGERVAAPVQLIDVLPTVADVLDLPVPADLRGVSLLEFLDSTGPTRRIYSETYYPRLHFGWSELTSLLDGNHQYIEGPDPELFDLVVDPGEKRNLLRQERRLYATLRDELSTYNRTLEGPEEADTESREALAALGYIGSAVGNLDGPLPDPKSRLPTLADLKAGFRHHSRGENAKAVEAFNKALNENPGMLDAWEYLAQSLQKLGRIQEALEAYRQALKLSGGAPHLTMAAASLFLQTGALEEAEAHARLALEQHPSFANGLLARIALRRDDLESAEALARQALDKDSPRLGPQITLANVLHARGKYEDALAMVQATEASFATRQTPDLELIRGLHLIAGKIHADLGQTLAAEGAFKREVELFPDEIHAYSNLAVLYGLTGRMSLVSRTLRQMVEARPEPKSYAEAVKTLRALGLDPGAQTLLRYALGEYPGSPELRQLQIPG
jgi:arylsulfatase A-like enzyme/Flp pilus assembly protein TadD